MTPLPPFLCSPLISILKVKPFSLDLYHTFWCNLHLPMETILQRRHQILSLLLSNLTLQPSPFFSCLSTVIYKKIIPYLYLLKFSSVHVLRGPLTEHVTTGLYGKLPLPLTTTPSSGPIFLLTHKVKLDNENFIGSLS